MTNRTNFIDNYLNYESFEAEISVIPEDIILSDELGFDSNLDGISGFFSEGSFDESFSFTNSPGRTSFIPNNFFSMAESVHGEIEFIDSTPVETMSLIARAQGRESAAGPPVFIRDMSMCDEGDRYNENCGASYMSENEREILWSAHWTMIPREKDASK
mmetsp:Transcript_3031/g.4604  ORF Transcript_3031/g.4604 Transcript_3031/m.4604 type:complete len:159 (+) Transcript_3031:168-644(+)